MISSDDLDNAWAFSSHHRGMQGMCGCFHCNQTFDAAEIVRWTDNDTTAYCPYCGIDSVLPGENARIDPEFLAAMQRQFFHIDFGFLTAMHRSFLFTKENPDRTDVDC